METKGVPLNLIRGLLIEQQGRCAVTGIALDPAQVNGDHIIPLSRRELKPPDGAKNLWIVTKRINAMKGTMTYNELVEASRLVMDHEEKSRNLIKMISSGLVRPVEKRDFDEWVEQHCDDDGVVV